ncbi:hypothetical protein M408DRAFT_326409 [Serendipita vermifera MAFF 305830]|uniref:UBA domain-containing protein n=1 Tax=Serendipita vermifera MAFF 305830 TaxID=933852 RepID=A0A0C3BKS6_SERVB|nr:hypothetical protein M408DRAFT_326409 [Serendipita vermifera MAFF 305830]
MDAFAGLAWDEPKSQKPQNATLGSQHQRQLTPAQSSLSSSSDSFGKLASAGQHIPISPKPTHYTSNGSASTAIPTSGRATTNQSGGDPFSGLFARGGSPNVNMSMADRRAHAERERREKERREKEKLDAQGAMWDQLDSTFSANGSKPTSRVASPSPAIFSTRANAAASPPIGLKTNPGVKTATSPPLNTDLFWSMHHSPPSASSGTSSPALVPQRVTPSTRPLQPSSNSILEQLGSRPTPTSSHRNSWSQLDALAAPKPSAASTSQPTAGLDPFDLDFLEETDSPIPQPTSHQPTPPRSRARTPGDFDFNERSFDSGVSTDEDDILGDLAKPVERKASPEIPIRPAAVRTTSSSSLTNGARSVSPPPHLIGQIVEMGFTPVQARVALAATDTGMNVEAALESLLAAGGDFASAEPYRKADVPRTSRSRQATRDSLDNGPPRASGTSTPSSITAQLQADKLLAQASEIGFNMFSKANAFWNQGKEAVQKAYEESVKTSGTPNPPPPTDGRPKWMTGDVIEPVTPVTASVFRDDSDVGLGGSFQPPEPQQRSRPVDKSLPAVAPSQSARNLIFEDEAPTYVSPHRRKSAAPNTSRAALPADTPAPRRSVASSRPAPQPSRVKIVVPEASSAAIASCVSSRTKGTELFKLGQYGDAEAAYTVAITSLPPTHILLASLYTNRAAARLKTGDSGGAVGDCTNVFRLMNIGDDMAGLMDLDDGKAWKFDGVPGKMDLREQAVKALQRRAAGLEMMERWEKARVDWERLAGLNWAQAQGRVKEEATRSAARCRGMVNSAMRPNESGSTSTDLPRAAPSRPKPRPTPRPSGPSRPSEASKRLKAAEVALELEENERIQLKDSVDARIQSWKGGKEANLRALIASLETVLWPELGWVKVGMHELVTPSQVKIRYTKAIAKVHPDKLKTGNTTVEQRMIANGVFAGLNEAWGAFQQ